MNDEIIPNIVINVKQFYMENIPFRTLQVQKASGIFGKVKKEYIAKYPTRYKGIQINWNGYINALCFDCDHDDVLEYQDFDLPEPTITTINQKNGKHHHVYFLRNPIPLSVASNKTIKYLRDVYDSLTDKLEADINYTNTITKNFLNKKAFRIIGSLKKYDLNDFTEHISNKKKKNNTKVAETIFSRHLALFDEIRFFGYSIAKECRDETQLYASLLNYAEQINKIFDEHIKTKYIVKNVTKFCWKNRFNFNSSKWNWDGYEKKDKKLVTEIRSKREKRKTIKKISKKWSEFLHEH